MALDQSLIDWASEAIEPLGLVTFRHMMGGTTLYRGGTVFAIIANEALGFKADKISDAIWDAARCDRFTFDMNEKTRSMNYRRAPEAIHDDAEDLYRCGALALEAGRRAPIKKKKLEKKT
jgi:DNA transformation protein and related proteins